MAKARFRVIKTYARRQRDGMPMKCEPGELERYGAKPRKNRVGNDGKIIYDTRESAEACAATLRERFGDRLYVYPCDRSKTGHHHLATDRSK